MLMLTEDAIRIIRSDAAKRENAARAKAKQKLRQLGVKRRERYVELVLPILKSFTTSHFEYEAACRTGVRRNLIMSGWQWADTDNAAAEVVEKALALMGVERPSWAEGQPEHADNSSYDRHWCVRCGTPISDERRATGRAKYCSELCTNAAGLERARRDDGHMSLAAWLAQQAETRERTVRERTRPCAHCEKPFLAMRPLQETCSRTCAGKYRAGPSARECKACGKPFRSRMVKGARTKFCSRSCSVSARTTRPVESLAPRPVFECKMCGVSFQGRRLTRPRSFCSKSCTMKARHLRQKLSHFACDAVENEA